jgi:hypothetical protein
MKFKLFSILAVLFLFSANVEAREQKDTTKVKIVNSSPVMQAIEAAEQAEAKAATNLVVSESVAVADTTISLMNLDFSTKEKSKQSVIYLIAFILALLPRFFPTLQDWLVEDKNYKAVRIISMLLVIIVPIAIFGFNKADLPSLLRDILELITAVTFTVGFIINPAATALKKK